MAGGSCRAQRGTTRPEMVDRKRFPVLGVVALVASFPEVYDTTGYDEDGAAATLDDGGVDAVLTPASTREARQPQPW